MSLPFTCTGSLDAHLGLLNVLRFNSRGEYFFSGGADKSVRLWNASSRAVVQTYTSHGWEVLDVAVSSDNRRFTSCGGDKAVFLWDIEASTALRRYSGHLHRINAVAFNEDASVVVSGSYDSTVRVWDCKSHNRDPIQILDDAKDSVTCVSIQDCCIVTGSVDGHLRSYDIRNGKLVTDFLGPPIVSLSIVKDSKTFVVGTLDNTVRLIDHSTGDTIKAFVGIDNTTYKVCSVYEPQQKYVISGSESLGACVWRVLDAESLPIQRLNGHRKGVISVDASPSQNTVITGGSEGNICFWRYKYIEESE